jgi:hypothetical protein
MKMMLIAAALITFPAVIALIYSLLYGPVWLTYAALASAGLNTLPFLAAGFMMRGRDGGHGDESH